MLAPKMCHLIKWLEVNYLGSLATCIHCVACMPVYITYTIQRWLRWMAMTCQSECSKQKWKRNNIIANNKKTANLDASRIIWWASMKAIIKIALNFVRLFFGRSNNKDGTASRQKKNYAMQWPFIKNFLVCSTDDEKQPQTAALMINEKFHFQ